MNVPIEFATEAVKTMHSAFSVEPFHRPEIIETSFKLRKTLRDYVDSIIVATAATLEEDITAENTLILAKKQEIKKQYSVNILTYKDLVKT